MGDHVDKSEPARYPRRLSGLTKAIIWIAAIVVMLAIIAPNLGPTSAEVRLDTGDLRYRWFGIPLEFESMPEPYRTKIVRLAAIAPAVSLEWKNFGHPTIESNPHLQCRSTYFQIADWSDVDPALARLLLIDTVEEARATHFMGQVTPAFGRAFPVLRYHIRHGSFAGWKTDPEVLAYCAYHGYMPPP